MKLHWDFLNRSLVSPTGWMLKHTHFHEVASTQSVELTDKLDKNVCHLLTAEKQSAGRGRGERSWVSGAGNFFGTLVLPKPEPTPFPLSTIGLLTSAALASGLAEFVNLPRLKLKWPNDVLIGESKVAGILVTATRSELRVGLGMNVCSAPSVEWTSEVSSSSQNVGSRPACCLLEALATEQIETAVHRWQWFHGFWDRFFSFYESWLEKDEHPWRDAYDRFFPWNIPQKLRDGRTVIPLRLGESGELWVKDANGLSPCYVEEIL